MLQPDKIVRHIMKIIKAVTALTPVIQFSQPEILLISYPVPLVIVTNSCYTDIRRYCLDKIYIREKTFSKKFLLICGIIPINFKERGIEGVRFICRIPGEWRE